MPFHTDEFRDKPKSKRKPKRKVMKEFDLQEISIVDSPAQAPARVAIIKREDFETEKVLLKPKKGEAKRDFVSRFMEDEKAKKEFPKQDQRLAIANRSFDKSFLPDLAVLTSVAEGHQHILDGSLQSGQTSWEKSEGEENGHHHSWVRSLEDGQIVIGMAEGHGHEPLVNKADLSVQLDGSKIEPESGDSARQDDGVQKAGNNEEMSEQTQATVEELTAKQEELVKRADRAEAIIALPVDQRAYFDALKSDEQDQFLAGKDEDRVNILKRVQESDPVIYKSTDGREFRKSDDENLVAEVKRGDEMQKRLDQSDKIAKRASFEKQATEELVHLKGSGEAKADLLEAVSKIEDETRRESVLEIVKSKDAGMALAMTRIGKKDEDAKSHEQVIEGIAKRLRESDSNLTPEEAYSKALETPEGLEAFSALRNGEDN